VTVRVKDLADSARLADAYNAIAGIYDRGVEHSAWMRAELRRDFLATFRAGNRILDVGCGTGTEAAFLAANGMRVTAMDVSPDMIERTRRRVDGLGLADRVECIVADVRDLDTWPVGQYEGIISTFAALNMVNSLSSFSSDAARLLAPGGRMVLHLSNRFCIQELMSLMSRGHPRQAWRLGKMGDRSFMMAGRPMVIYLSAPHETYEWFFAREFELTRAYALGIVRPYADQKWMPGILRDSMGLIERGVRNRKPFVGWGRFFTLRLIKRD